MKEMLFEMSGSRLNSLPLILPPSSFILPPCSLAAGARLLLYSNPKWAVGESATASGYVTYNNRRAIGTIGKRGACSL